MTLEELQAQLENGTLGDPPPPIHRQFAKSPQEFPSIPCEDGRPDCRATPSVLVDSRTMYDWNGEGEDPNRDKIMCRECAADYNEQMNSQWADYNNGRM